jgi:hypothetical protein
MRGASASSSVSSAPGTGYARRTNRGLARSRVHRAILLCLLALIPVRESEAAKVTPDQPQRPDERSKGWYGFEVGPTFSLPLPAASANRDVIGLDAGLSCTGKTSPILGIGASIAYHYWPVSTKTKREFNETLHHLELGGGTWGLQVVQVGGHVRVAAPTTRSTRPWLQVGLSVYRVDPNTRGYSGNAGFFTVVAPPLDPTHHLGYSVAVGADLFGGPSARMGLDATYHFVDCINDRFGDDHFSESLQVFTLGAHLLLGW